MEVELIDRERVLRLMPRRSAGAHKWSVGGLIIIAGAPCYVGAPALCALGAARSGAGIINLAVPRSAIAPVASIIPEAAFIPLPEGNSPHIAFRSAELIRQKLQKSRATVVGPGLSEDEQASSLLAALFGWGSVSREQPFGFGSAKPNGSTPGVEPILGSDKVAVVDADGLNWLSTQPDWWSKVQPHSLVLTPHTGEMARLVEIEAKEIDQDPAAVAEEAARSWQQTVVLKSGVTVVSNGRRTLSTRRANPALATAGTGDILAGSIGAFLAQGLSPLDAASLAVFAGEAAALELVSDVGTLGLIASDLPLGIARQLAILESEAKGQM